MSGHSAQELARTHAGRIYGVVVVKAARRKSLRALGRLYVKARAFGPPDRGVYRPQRGSNPLQRGAPVTHEAPWSAREVKNGWGGVRMVPRLSANSNRGNNSGRGVTQSFRTALFVPPGKGPHMHAPTAPASGGR